MVKSALLENPTEEFFAVCLLMNKLVSFNGDSGRCTAQLKLMMLHFSSGMAVPSPASFSKWMYPSSLLCTRINSFPYLQVFFFGARSEFDPGPWTVAGYKPLLWRYSLDKVFVVLLRTLSGHFADAPLDWLKSRSWRERSCSSYIADNAVSANKQQQDAHVAYCISYTVDLEGGWRGFMHCSHLGLARIHMRLWHFTVSMALFCCDLICLSNYLPGVHEGGYGGSHTAELVNKA